MNGWAKTELAYKLTANAHQNVFATRFKISVTRTKDLNLETMKKKRLLGLDHANFLLRLTDSHPSLGWFWRSYEEYAEKNQAASVCDLF